MPEVLADQIKHYFVNLSKHIQLSKEVFLICGVWSVGRCLWGAGIDCGVRGVDCGVWGIVCGVRDMTCRMRG